MKKNKGLKTTLDFRFDINEEVPNLDYEIFLKKRTRTKIKITKKNERDPSANHGLF